MSSWILTALIAIPLVGALFLAGAPRKNEGLFRWGSLAFMAVNLVLSISLLSSSWETPGLRYVVDIPWIEQFGIAYKVGLDGISLWLVLLTTLLTPVALFASWLSVNQRIKEFAIAFLALESAMIGTFVALDLFLFYVFWELMLVPMYLIVGVWGGKDKIYAALKFFLYTMVGSLLMLVAILYVGSQYHALTGIYSFDLQDLSRVALPYSSQIWLFSAFALAFAIKVPMFPFHTWLPDAHTQAPTGGSVILAAVMLKLGTYGFLRFAMPMFPLAAHYLGPTIAAIAIIGIIYGAFCAWMQKDVKKLVAYSSVSHLGFVMLGIFSLNASGVSGAILQMVNHGISTGALFILVGVIYDRRHTRLLSDFGGLAAVMPLYAVLFVITSMSSIGLPGTNGFIGEFMILAGTFASNALQPWSRIFVLCAATGVILAAIYMLHAVLKMFWGPVTHEANKALKDINLKEGLALAPLMLLVFWIGLFPNHFLKPMESTVEQYLARYQSKLVEINRDDSLRLLPPELASGAAAPIDEEAEQQAEQQAAARKPSGDHYVVGALEAGSHTVSATAR